MSRLDRRMQAARDLRDRMKAEGDPVSFRVIDDLLRSAAAAQSALKQLHADNRKLREQLEAEQ